MNLSTRTEWEIENVLESYEVNDDMKKFNILHIYDTGEKCREDHSGFLDSRHFDLWAFNSETNEKRFLGRHDGIISYDGISVFIIRVFIDGSLFVRTTKMVSIDFFTQEIVLKEV